MVSNEILVIQQQYLVLFIHIFDLEIGNECITQMFTKLITIYTSFFTHESVL